MSQSKINIPTAEEILRYAIEHPEDVEVARLMVLWEKLDKPDLKYYIALESNDEDNKFRIHMEPVEDEPWLRGVVMTFLTKKELMQYIRLLAEENHYGDIESYKVWSATLPQVINTLSGIIKGGRGVRVELHEVYVDGNMDYVDTLWDNVTN